MQTNNKQQVAMIHEVTDSEGEIEGDVKESFDDCCEDEDDSIPNADNYDSLDAEEISITVNVSW